MNIKITDMFQSKHDKKYLKLLVRIMQDELVDLEEWSTYNKDKYNKEISEIRELLEKIK